MRESAGGLSVCSGGDLSGFGAGIRDWLALLTQVRDVCCQRPLLSVPPPRRVSCPTRPPRQHRGRARPTPVLSPFVDDQAILHRRSFTPVARRIAASVPTGTVSESLPATVIALAPSALSHVSCDPLYAPGVSLLVATSYALP
jgi:hypothetical protein